MFNLNLPATHGPFPVGSTTFVHRLRSNEHSTIGDARLRANGKPALRLEEVAFAAYYPARVSDERGRGVDWMTRPLGESLRGYAHFGELSTPIVMLLWPILYVLGALLKIPINLNAPLLEPTSPHGLQKGDREQWPVVVFTHGLGGGRTAYSQFCARLASLGRVVLAVEHRDGTGHMSVDTLGNVKIYLQDNDVTFNGGDDNVAPTSDPLPFRREQLLMRRHEISLVYSAFLALSLRGKGEDDPPIELQTVDDASIDWASWGEARVHATANVGLAGHSFGGTTVLSILSNPPPDGRASIPVAHALILDPWLEPIASPGPYPYRPSNASPRPNILPIVGPHELDVHSSADHGNDPGEAGNSKEHPRILVINSEGFTLWKDHFERLKGVVDCWGGDLLTLVRASHMSFSDFPLLPLPGLQKASSFTLMDLIVRLGDRFLVGKTQKELLEGAKTRKLEAVEVPGRKEGPRQWSRKLLGEPGDVCIE